MPCLKEECVNVTPIIRLLRPADWAKNIFVLPALLFSIPALEESGAGIWPLAGKTALAVVSFSLLSSVCYILNDILDRERDRLHPVKRLRPMASGAVSTSTAAVLAAGLLAASIALGFMIHANLLLVLVLYLLLQACYNAGLKRIMFVDATTVAIGFALRAAAGAVAIDRPMSIWLLLSVFFLCLYLAFIKRLCDLSLAEREEGSAWQSPAGYNDRTELNWQLGISGTLAVLTYMMYALSDHALDLFGPRAVGFALLTPLVLICMHRFYRRASGGRSDSPVAALREDPIVFISLVGFSVGMLMILYVPAIARLLEGFFTMGMIPWT